MREDSSGIELAVRFPGLHVNESLIDGDKYKRLSVPGCGEKGEAGLPAVPFRGIFFTVPEGTELELEIDTGPEVEVLSEAILLPRQKPLPECGKACGEFTRDEDFYGSDLWYPEDPVRIAVEGRIRGRRVVYLEASPVRYNPARGLVVAYPDLDISLSFGGEKKSGRRGEMRPAGPFFEDLFDRFIENHRAAEAAVEVESNPTGTEYLIVAADSLVSCAEPLAEWKRLKGYTTEVVPMSAAGATAADLKDYLQGRYDQEDLTYLLLLGDHPAVPSWDMGGNVSDLPYSLLDGSDNFPDVVIGRLPVGSEQDCSTAIGKILEFDRTPQPGDWYDWFLLAAKLEGG